MTSFHYNENVCNAFESAGALAQYVSSSGSGEKIVIAHSLGNMVVSSAIQDYNMNVKKYFMLNSAVPSEAYNANLSDVSQENPLVHDEWRLYASRTWAAMWHQRFPSYDSRNKLTWKNRFPKVVSKAHNFYSSGDEVLELYSRGTPGSLTGATTSIGRYAWHKQESYKGRAKNVHLAWAATDWSGWGFRENLFGLRMYSAEEANAIFLTALTTNTVFNLNPTSMNAFTISRTVLDQHLAMGIPSLSPATGAMQFRDGNDDVNLDLNVYNANLFPHGWWRNNNNDLDDRWLHSDMKNAAYYFIYPIFEKLIIEGGLR